MSTPLGRGAPIVAGLQQVGGDLKLGMAPQRPHERTLGRYLRGVAACRREVAKRPRRRLRGGPEYDRYDGARRAARHGATVARIE